MLQEWSGGKQEALDALLPFVYEELRRQASRYLRRERAGHT
ncbi:MAG: ECF-type sigma factor, partial [Acidobacteriota bacterium]|nr:ECF-type sigma factor [Acidobacteriota bacterium]